MKPSCYLILALLFQLTLGQVVCDSNQINIKLVIQTKSTANAQSFMIIGGTTTLFTSPTLANNDLRLFDICITASTNSQYSLKMTDSKGDSWETGSWLEVQGMYGNIAFKNYMSETHEETYPLSLYYGVLKSLSWRVTVSASGSWTTYSYDDSNWQLLALPSSVTSLTGTQFFRHQFTGLPDMASFEARFHYRYGIVAYINGQEIYRDNMPSGAIDASTPASGNYVTVEYRGMLRSALHVSAAQSVLAVEIHYRDVTTENAVSFDAFLAIYASSVIGQKCSVVTTPVTITSASGVTNAVRIFDFGRTSFMSSSISTQPIIIKYAFDSIVRPVVNGIDVWPGSAPTKQAKSFIFGGSHDDSSTSVFNPIVGVVDQVYSTLTHQHSFGHFNIDHFKHYRLTITHGVSNTLSLYEIMPLVCNLPLPNSIQFEPSIFVVYPYFQFVTITPTIAGFSGCTVNPLLPTGLILDALTCSVTGIPSVASPMTTYTITSTAPITLSGQFVLTTPSCTGSLFSFRSMYTSDAVNQGFRVVDAANDNVLLTVAVNSGQSNNSERLNIVCVTALRIRVDFVDSSTYWSSGSFLYVDVMLDTEHVMTLGRVRKDNNLGLPLSSFYNARLPIHSQQQWFYKMGEVPTGWSSSVMTGWSQAVAGSFPASTNKIQLYKKTFTVDLLTNVAGFMLALKYKYGCVVYLNNVEVYRMGVDGAVSTDSISSNSYPIVIYRTITLPTKTMQIGDVAPVTYLHQGSNTIAIALISITNTQTASVFDCALSLMGDNEVNRAYDITTTQVGSTNLARAFDDMGSTYYDGTTCRDNTGTIVFIDDRREWISSVVIQIQYNSLTSLPTTFIIEARNPEDSIWTSMKNATGLQWSQIGQSKQFWLSNNKPYNQWRIRNVGSGKPTSCGWRINRIHFLSNSMTQDIPILSYETTAAYINVEMSEVYPFSDMYYEFSITPDLPIGINIDSHTGMISGISTTLVDSFTYTIQAHKATGGIASCSFIFSVEVCTGGKALMTVKMRIDTSSSESSYKLFTGRGISSQPIISFNSFPTGSIVYYIDFCLMDDIYTFMAQDSYGDGWSVPAGYSMSLDSGELLFDMNMVGSLGKPSQVSTVFSSFLPFQIEHTHDWMVHTSVETVAEEWKSISFDEADWRMIKAVDIGTSEAVTVYIRKSFIIPNLDDYQVLNVRMKFTGGAVVYLNGNKVARFNMIETYDETTSGGPARAPDSFAKFHIILPTAGVVVNSTNVMAIELHRAESESSTDSIVFDATGVFGVQDCSPVLDSFLSLNSSATLDSSTAADVFNMWPVDFLKMENNEEGHISWEVENLEGSRFNSYSLIGNSLTRLTFTLFARNDDTEEWLEIGQENSKSMISRIQLRFKSPISLIGFRQVTWKRTVATSSIMSIYNFYIDYCKTSGAVCSAADGYPSVTEGQVSPSVCPYGFRGYSFRPCVEGVLGEIDNSKCTHRVPENLQYSRSHFLFVRDTVVETSAPTIDYIVTRYFIDDGESLPQGLSIDALTGVIRGTPTMESVSEQKYTIRAENIVGSTFVEVIIDVRLGSCQADAGFPKTLVNQTAVLDCSTRGSFIGTQNRICVIGKTDGEWQNAWYQSTLDLLSSQYASYAVLFVLIHYTTHHSS